MAPFNHKPMMHIITDTTMMAKLSPEEVAVSVIPTYDYYNYCMFY